jgi:serine/threonine protein kinase
LEEIHFYRVWSYIVRLLLRMRYGSVLFHHLTTSLPLNGITQYARYTDRSNLPAILLAIAGNRLVVSAAIFTNAIYADELHSIRLHLGHHGSDCVLHVARVFMAINESAELLRGQYNALLALPHSLTSPLWPNPTPANPAESLPELEFFAKVNHGNGAELTTIDPANERHGMYLARTQIKNATQDVLVKFAAKYHEDAHRLLAGKNPPLAPDLYFCNRVIGGMYMVVMEYIPESRGRSLSSLRRLEFSSKVIDLGVTKALDFLHEQDLVFGDLREPNVLYLPEGEGRVLLVDFDGVGQDGVDRYSAALNPKARLGVRKRQIMERLHDEENLKRLMERLSARVPQ